MQSSQDTLNRIKTLVETHRVVLFMKGERRAPQCGFSATVVGILDGLVEDYVTVDVLADPALRQGIKDFSSWPTIPQLYVAGEFIGGCDIVRELHASGELQSVLGVRPAQAAPPSITVTAAAATALRQALAEAETGEHVRVGVDARFQHTLELGPRSPSDLAVEAGGLTLLVAPGHAARLDGVVIDYVENLGQTGFRIDNPNAPAPVAQLGAQELKEMLERGTLSELFDVRTPEERDIARIEGARLLDDAAVAHIEKLPRDTPLAFHCHHGGRSQAAAEHFRSLGFRRVYNLRGGIDAWSLDVDPDVPRY
jgi:monothiol glutaredoxin